MKNKKFYQLDISGKEANINIYGNISSCPYEFMGEVSANNLKKEIDGLEVDTINVYINSYGGEVAEALAIYSALQRHKAAVHTFIDGFACSAATIIFCAGATRTVSKLGLMMIHNCMSYVGYANTEELLKKAEDNEKINSRSIEAYKAVSNLSEEEIKTMMNKETWMNAEECLKYGFATEIEDADSEDESTQQSAFASIHGIIMGRTAQQSGDILQDILDTVKEIRQKQITIKDIDVEATVETPQEQKMDSEKKPEEQTEMSPVLQNLFKAFKGE